MRNVDVLFNKGRSGWAFLLTALFLVSCSAEVTKEVSFSRTIQPVLNEKCLKCHFGGRAGFDMTRDDSHHDLVKYMVAGKAATSRLYVKMLEGHSSVAPMTAEELAALKDWINQGAQKN